MILKHLLEDLSRIAASAHPYTETNIHNVEINETGVYFEYDTTDLDMAKDEIRQNEDTIRKLEGEYKELEEEKEKIENELTQLTEWANQIKADGVGAALGELLENNQWQEQELARYKETTRNFLVKLRESDSVIEKLRARKNTAKVMERDRTSGKLIVEYQRKKFYLEEIK